MIKNNSFNRRLIKDFLESILKMILLTKLSLPFFRRMVAMF